MILLLWSYYASGLRERRILPLRACPISDKDSVTPCKSLSLIGRFLYIILRRVAGTGPAVDRNRMGRLSEATD